MPIYKAVCKVPSKNETLAEETRLIESANMATAMRHATERWVTIEKCTMSEAVELGAAGVKVEKAE